MRPAHVLVALLVLGPPADRAFATTAQLAGRGPIARALQETKDARTAGFPSAPNMGPDWETDDWDWVDRAEPEPRSEERTVWKAVAASALVPGLGEAYVGHSGRAKLFGLVEGAIWSTFAFYRIQAEGREDRHVEFAGTQAGAPADQNADYYEHIGFWLSIDEWHDVVRQDARLRFPDDPESQAAFFDANKRYDAGQAWQWADDGARTEYRRLRSRTERSYRNARLAAGAALFNRFASMIDALALARGHNRRVAGERAKLDLRIGPAVTSAGLVVGPVVSTRY